jgi:His/Glu/Gln/Arg/opine family amino acid ABC transporter permease subunit
MIRFRAAICLCVLPLAGCGSQWAWYVVNPTDPRGLRNLAFMVDGFWATIRMSFAATLLALLLGLAIALCGLARARPLRWFNLAWVELLRATPPLVVILWVFYGLPIALGLHFDIFTAAVLAIGVCDSAFQAEIFRAGIASIEAGQHDAAKALGLTGWQRFRLVILPQAVRRILPPLANQFITVLKLSSLASVIGFPDLTRRANELVVSVYRPLEIYSALIVEYLGLVLAISGAIRWLERRLSVTPPVAPAAGRGRAWSWRRPRPG